MASDESDDEDDVAPVTSPPTRTSTSASDVWDWDDTGTTTTDGASNGPGSSTAEELNEVVDADISASSASSSTFGGHRGGGVRTRGGGSGRGGTGAKKKTRADFTEFLSTVSEGLANGRLKTLTEKSKNRTSSVWGSMQVIVDAASGGDVGAVLCTKCNKCLKYTAGSTSSLKKHVTDFCPGVVGAAPVCTPIPPRLKSAFVDKLAEKVARDLSSVRNTTTIGMQGVVQAAINVGAACGKVDAGELMVQPNTVRNRLMDLTNKLRAEVMVAVREAIQDGRCSFTTDMWTEDMKKFKYLALTAHYVSTDWCLESWLLTVAKFPNDEDTTAVNIRESLIRELGILGVTEAEFERISWVTDRGSNIVKALETGDRADCLAHLLNTVLKNTLSMTFLEMRERALGLDVQTLALLERINEIPKFVKNFKLPAKASKVVRDKLVTLQKSLVLAQPFRFCYGKMLQSVVVQKRKILAFLRTLPSRREDLMVFLREAEEVAVVLVPFLLPLENTGRVVGAQFTRLHKHLLPRNTDGERVKAMKERLQGHRQLLGLYNIVKDCKELVTCVKTSGDASQLSKLPRQECDTRWNSLYGLMASLSDVYDEIVLVLQARNRSERLGSTTKDAVGWFAGFLRPFLTETDHLQGANYPTLPHALLAPSKLRRHLQPKAEDSEAQEILRRRAAAELERKVRPTMRHKVGMFLWPQYRKLTMLPEEQRTEVYQHVKTAVAAIAAQTGEGGSQGQGGQQRVEDGGDPADDEYDEWAELAEVAVDEVDLYLQSAPPTTLPSLLQYWKNQEPRLPRLSKLAQRELGKPATSAASERAFSDAGFVYQERRSRLNPATADSQLFLHSYFQNADRRRNATAL